MQLDPAKVAETREWLLHAFSDLESAGVLVAATPPHPDTALFHCQQGAEKSWKAYLFWHDVPFRRTHDLLEIGEAVARTNGALVDLARRAVVLTEFAWAFRYPGAPRIPTRAEAEDGLQLAREVYAAVLAELPLDVRP